MVAIGPPTPASPPAATLRVTFAYRGRDLRLLASDRVAMIAPPAVTAPPAQGQSGHWFELRDAGGALLYHRALSNPMRSDVEVFSEDPRQSIARVPLAAPEGSFDVLVPDLPDARTFHFYGTPAGAPSEAAPSQELYRADVDALRKPGTGGAPPRAGSPPPGTAAP